MPNKNYIKGVKKERMIVNSFRNLGHIAFRSAGSHSPIDVCCINQVDKEIYFFQCKPDTMSEKKKNEILKKLEGLKGEYKISIEVL